MNKFKIGDVVEFKGSFIKNYKYDVVINIYEETIESYFYVEDNKPYRGVFNSEQFILYTNEFSEEEKN